MGAWWWHQARPLSGSPVADEVKLFRRQKQLDGTGKDIEIPKQCGLRQMTPDGTPGWTMAAMDSESLLVARY